MSFPNYCKDEVFKDLMKVMLDKNITTRYRNFSQIISHPWFNEFSFDDLISFVYDPPYKMENKKKNPEIKKDFNIYMKVK
ncbi:MAG: hypothetical protein MJ252_23305 [archaeon]|nr:hypothetical protein [archaeon]